MRPQITLWYTGSVCALKNVTTWKRGKIGLFSWVLCLHQCWSAGGEKYLNLLQSHFTWVGMSIVLFCVANNSLILEGGFRDPSVECMWTPSYLSWLGVVTFHCCDYFFIVTFGISTKVVLPPFEFANSWYDWSFMSALTQSSLSLIYHKNHQLRISTFTQSDTSSHPIDHPLQHNKQCICDELVAPCVCMCACERDCV